MDIGIFIIALGFGFIFTFVPFNTSQAVRGFLHIGAMALFLVLGVMSSSGFEVSQTNILTDGETTWTETRLLISEGTDNTWISIMFYGLAIYNLVFFVRDIFKGE